MSVQKVGKGAAYYDCIVATVPSQREQASISKTPRLPYGGPKR